MKKEKRKGNYRRLTQDDFISKCRLNQKVDLDYSFVEYTTQHDKSKVICNKHNHEFYQKNQEIMLGTIGCHYCLTEHKSKIMSGTLELFVEKFNHKFPDRNFDFSRVIYTKASEHIDVVCDKGHEFKAKPNNLMSGHGCPSCFNIKKGHLHNKGKDSYILKFIAVHGEKYDYSLVEDFKNCKQKVTVLCYEHGEFLITPDNHVQGKGCPLCGKSGFQPQLPASFYILKITEDVIKFGITSDLNRRLSEIQRSACFDIFPMYVFNFNSGYIASEIETRVYRDKSIIRSVVSKLDMPQGYVETTYYSNLSKILSIVDEYKDQLS